MRTRRPTLLLFASLAVAGCAGEATMISVDLQTDYVAGRDFNGLSVVAGDPQASDPSFTLDLPAFPEQRFADGVRVAEVPRGGAGELIVEVDLWAPDPAPGPGGFYEPIAYRTVLLQTAPPAITVVVTRSCAAVDCIVGPIGTWQECHGGTCVDPTCLPELDGSCGAPACSADGDCAATSACVRPRCDRGVCLQVPTDSRCAAGQVCDATAGCVVAE